MRTFCRRGGNPRKCDSGSAINSYRGLCWQFPEALWTLPTVCCEGWQLFKANKVNLFVSSALFISGTIHLTF
jgi:hypothetical protein